MADARGALAFALLAALAGGCGVSVNRGPSDEKPRVIDWDLRRSHTVADVRWPRPDLTATEIAPIDSVRIRFPGEEVLEAGEEVHDVTLEREGDLVTLLQIDSHPRTTEDTYRLALRWARDWRLPRAPLDEWYEERVAGRKRGREDLTSRALTTKAGLTVGPGGPVPSVQIRYSFEDARPSLASVQFYWGRMPDLGGE